MSLSGSTQANELKKEFTVKTVNVPSNNHSIDFIETADKIQLKSNQETNGNEMDHSTTDPEESTKQFKTPTATEKENDFVTKLPDSETVNLTYQSLKTLLTNNSLNVSPDSKAKMVVSTEERIYPDSEDGSSSESDSSSEEDSFYKTTPSLKEKVVLAELDNDSAEEEKVVLAAPDDDSEENIQDPDTIYTNYNDSDKGEDYETLEDLIEEPKPLLLDSIIIDKKADLMQYPSLKQNEKLLPGQVATIGDMHGNALKFIYILIRLQIINIDKEKYQNLIEIIATPIPEAPEEIEKFTNNFKRYNEIIREAFKTVNPTNVGQLRLLGDLFGDRGLNDCYMLSIFEYIPAPIIKTILISNHDYYMLIDIYNLNHPNNQLKAFFEEKHQLSFKQSSINLKTIIRLGIVKLEWVNEVLDKHYKPYLKLIDYAQIENTHNTQLTIHTHAPVAFCLQLVKAHNKITKEKYLIRELTLPIVINIIDNLNNKTKENLLSTELQAVIFPFFDNRLNDLKQHTVDQLRLCFPESLVISPELPKMNYALEYVSGHDNNNNNQLHFDDILTNTYTLDNEFGKSSQSKGTYITKITPEPRYLELVFFIKLMLPSIYEACHALDETDALYIPFASAIANYECFKKDAEFQQRWLTATTQTQALMRRLAESYINLSLLAPRTRQCSSELKLIPSKYFSPQDIEISNMSRESSKITQLATLLKKAGERILLYKGITPQQEELTEHHQSTNSSLRLKKAGTSK